MTFKDRNYDFSSTKIDSMQYTECAGCTLQSSSMTFKKVHYTISNWHPKIVVKNYFSSTAAQKFKDFSIIFKGLEFQ